MIPPTTMAAEPDQRPTRKATQAVLALTATAAVVVGIQLGTIPWRYRRQMWQLQGALVGAVAGFIAGRLTRSNDSAK